MLYKFNFYTLVPLVGILFNLLACGDDTSSGPEGISVKYRVDSIDNLEKCTQELENERAYTEKDSSWRICKSFKVDSLVEWGWEIHININGELYPYGYAPAGTYDCNIYDCVTTQYLNPSITYGEYLDRRDNKVYKTVYIGDQLWMAQNLAYTPDNGIFAEANSHDLDSTKKGYYYKAGNYCPVGWAPPTKDDFTKLVQFTGDTTLNALKSANDKWENSDTLTNPFGFSLVKTMNMNYYSDELYEELDGLVSKWSANGSGAYLWLNNSEVNAWWHLEVNEYAQNYDYYTVYTAKTYNTIRCMISNYFLFN